MDAPSYDQIVSALYRAGAAEQDWRSALGLVTRAYQGLATQYITIDNATGGLTYSEACGAAPAEAELEYLRHFHKVDPRTSHLMTREVGEWMYCQDLFDESVAETEPYYRDFLIPYGGRYSATVKVSQDAHETVLLGFQSKLGTGPFTDDQREFISRIGIHLRQSIGLFRKINRLHAKERVGVALLARFRKPAFVLGADRQFSGANDAARQVMDSDGGLVFIKDDKLRLMPQALDEALTVAIAALNRDGANAAGDIFVPLVSPHVAKWIGLSVSCLRANETMHAFGSQTQMLVVLHPRTRGRSVDPALLQSAFNLTRAEANVARQIYEGHEPSAIAQKLGVSITTVRSHLAMVYEKTGVTRQADLVLQVADLLSQ